MLVLRGAAGVTDGEKAPRNWFERLLALHGRKFWIAFFAGVSAFVVTLIGIWVTARVSVDTGRTVEQIVNGYLWTSAGMVGVYSGSNTLVERAHAKAHTNGTPPRQSGTVHPPETE